MPIYGYRCSNCGHADDHMQKLSDAPLTTCPSCQQASYEKQLSAAGFQLKGSGWYATDFKSNSKSAPKETKDESATTAPSTPCGGGCACH